MKPWLVGSDVILSFDGDFNGLVLGVYIGVMVEFI